MRKWVLSLLFSLAFGAGSLAQLPPPPQPAENPISEAKRILGKILFWDEQLSSDNRVACGSCHSPARGGGDARAAIHPGFDGIAPSPDDVVGSPGVARADADGLPVEDPLFGFDVQVTRRSTNSTIGAAYAPELFHDGRARTLFVDPESLLISVAIGGALENQAIAPILSDVEMAHEGRDWDDVREKLSRSVPLLDASALPADVAAALAGNPSYADLFAAAFGTEAITAERIAFAIAGYERTLVADQTPWDAFVQGNPTALTPIEQQGWIDFQVVNCDVCHTPPFFTNHTFRNIGIRPPVEDLGRQEVTGNPVDRGRFKTPTLRNAGLRDSFMHNGQLTTIQQAVAWYRINNPDRFPQNLDPLLPLNVAPPQVNAISAFIVGGLTDPRVAAEQFPFDRPVLHAGALDSLGFPSGETLGWQPLEGAQSYRIYRGDLSDLSDGNGDGLPDGGFGDCVSTLDADDTDAMFADGETPDPGSGFFYLRGFVDSQAAERGLGATSGGQARRPALPCP